jgi:hypothetical protein
MCAGAQTTESGPEQSGKMLHELLASHDEQLIRRCREKAAQRFNPAEVPAAIDHGVPLFLRQLGATLRLEQMTPVRDVPGSQATPAQSEFGRAAALHGAEMLRLGYSIDQVVHEYGDVCQSVTEVAVELNEKISADEFRTLNRCLDDAIADAVTSFGSARQVSINDQARTLDDRLSAFSDEHRRLLDIATQSYSAIRTGNVGVTGATSTLLIHALEELRSLVERTLSEIHPSAAATSD